MNKEKIFSILTRFLFSILLTFVVCASVSSFSCKITPDYVSILTGDYLSPKLDDFNVVDSKTIQFFFTKKIKFTDLRVWVKNESMPEKGIEDLIKSTLENDTVENGYEYVVSLPNKTENGINYLLYAVVKDEGGNTLSFSTEFIGYNDNLPEIILSEVRVQYSKPKCEYIELYVLKDGNIGGITIESIYNTKPVKFIFPAVDVKKGDYILLHGRQLEESVDEIGENTSISVGVEAVNEVRDFWIPSTTKTIGKTGIILLRERENGEILDCLLYAESNKENWTYEPVIDAATQVLEISLWKVIKEECTDLGFKSAVCSDGATLTKTLSRQNIDKLLTSESEYPFTVSANDWIVVATSCATPGFPNSDKPAIKSLR